MSVPLLLDVNDVAATSEWSAWMVEILAERDANRAFGRLGWAPFWHVFACGVRKRAAGSRTKFLRARCRRFPVLLPLERVAQTST